MAFWDQFRVLVLLVCMVSRSTSQGDDRVSSGFGNPDDDDYWTMIDDEDYIEIVEERDFSVTATPSKDCSVWITMLENREAVMFSLRKEIEQMASSYCGCKLSIDKERLACRGNELLYSGNITQTPGDSKEDLVQQIQRWAWDEPKLNTTLSSGETLLLQVVKPAEPPPKPGNEGQTGNSRAEATIHATWPRWLLVTSILTHFMFSWSLVW